MIHFRSVTLFDLILTFSKHQPYTFAHLFHTLRSIKANYGFAAFASPVSVTDMAKKDDFNLHPDLDLTRSLFTLPASVWALCIALVALVCEIGGGGGVGRTASLQRDAFSCIFLRGTG